MTNYTKFMNWHIYQEGMKNKFSHTFFHNEYDGTKKTSHLQGVGYSISDCIEQIKKLELAK